MMSKGKILFCLVVLLLTAGGIFAQLPLVRGTSAAQSGMLSYNVHEADDMVARTYLYTLCPQNASCTSLDFTLLESGGERDFIRVFDGADRDAPLLAQLGGNSGSIYLEAGSGCLTFEFTRLEDGLRSVWTALWRGTAEADCIDPGRKIGKGLIQDVCGPEFRENRSLWKAPASDANLPVSYTYRLMPAKDGKLNFSILPDNQSDDYDWELYYMARTDDTASANTSPQKMLLACNFSSGSGPDGLTGMVANHKGSRFLTFQKGTYNPYFQEVTVQQGVPVFLRVFAGEQQCHGFRLLFNETVMQCDQPVGELIRLSHAIATEKPKIPNQNAFSRSTQIWRLDLSSKANAGLADSPVRVEDWSEKLEIEKESTPSFRMPETNGLAGMLLLGLKAGLFPAFASHDFKTPVHYGNLMEVVSRMSGSSDSEHLPEEVGSIEEDWWNPDPEKLSGFKNMIELIVDEVFSKSSGTKKVQIRFIRLVWSDWEGGQPDLNIAIFRYSDLLPVLSRIQVQDFRNQARSISMQDLLESRSFEHVMSWRSGRPAGSAANGQFLKRRDQELESYYWE
jgi:hypothetical protein